MRSAARWAVQRMRISCSRGCSNRRRVRRIAFTARADRPPGVFRLYEANPGADARFGYQAGGDRGSDQEADGRWRLTTRLEAQYLARAVVLATGTF